MPRDSQRLRPFLTARWERLALFSYQAPRELLEPRLPPGLSLDLSAPGALAGCAFVSLVAFEFRCARVFGVRWPGHAEFPEINLRFYVRESADPGRRGVMFIREFAPRRLTCAIASLVYNEPYARAAMTCASRQNNGEMTLEHRWNFRGAEHSIALRAGPVSPVPPPADSVEHWFKEHEWGYGVTRRRAALRYRVEHPVWRIFPVRSWDLRADFARLYGAEWAFLNQARPASVVLAEGSEVAVFPAGG